MTGGEQPGGAAPKRRAPRRVERLPTGGDPGQLALLDALARPQTYGCGGIVERHETHASWVFIAGDHAYKLKKPVRLAFLDYGTPALRRAACHEEIRVNRELGGDIYGEVLAVVRDGERFALAPEDAAGAVDYVLRMRRFDVRRTLAAAVEAGGPADADLSAVAARLASFHRAASVADAGGAQATLDRWRADIDELAQLVAGDAWNLAGMRRFAAAFVSRRGGELDRRARCGLVRDGHGDLRCEHILLGEPLTIVDRIEFDPALRRIDVGCDLAFLLMDLEALGRPGAARTLLAGYRAAGGDPGPDELVWFHAARWALVRAKVAVIARSRAREAQRDLAERLCWRARGRLVVVIAGAPASGKSTLAAALAARSGLPTASSDVVRKELAGLEPVQRAADEHYGEEFTSRTYRALAAAAREQIDAGGAVIVDATFGRPADRVALHEALAGSGADFVYAECRVTRQTAISRARAREQVHGGVSDATAEIAAQLFDSHQPPTELGDGGTLALDAEGPVEQQLDAIAAAADRALSDARGLFGAQPST